MTSTVKVNNLRKVSESADRDISGVAAAWVNFNGTGVIANRDSLNVSSLTDNGTGQYYVNYSNDMANDDYSFSYYFGGGSGTNLTTFSNSWGGGHDLEIGRVGVSGYHTSYIDSDMNTVQVIGDLA